LNGSEMSASLVWQVVGAPVTPPFEFGELFRQLDDIGSKALPLVALAGAATGVVLSLEGRSARATSAVGDALVAKLPCGDGVFTTYTFERAKAVHRFDRVISHSSSVVA
jgi:hypothetical protein